MSSPAKVIASYLVGRGVGAWPGTASDWYVYYAKEPNDEIDPNNTVTVYDEDPNVEDGRMRGGRNVVHPGINIRVRSMDVDVPGDGYDSGWDKGQEVLDRLSELGFTQVVVAGDATEYEVQCYTVGRELAFLKEEDPLKKRQIFVLNGGHITLWVGGV